MIEQMKQWLEALEECRRDPRLKYDHPALDNAITSLRQAIAEAEKQEPVAFASHGVVNWIADKQFQHEADLYTHPQPTEERNFCPRCGKRTNDIHTCTPPQREA